MDQAKKLIENVTNYMEKDVRGTQIGCYSLALAGLTLAIRKVRPFTIFKKPSDIPNHFFKEKRQLVGVVQRIDPIGGLLMIQHKPLITLPGSSKNAQLPVKVSGVNVSGLGISWLQTIVAGQEVKFIPIVKDKNFVQCEVILPQEYIDAKKRKQIRMLDVGESLVMIGFGQLDANKPLNNPYYESYYNRLEYAEQYALLKKLGIKYYIKPAKLLLLALANKIHNLYSKSAKKAVVLPKVIQT